MNVCGCVRKGRQEGQRSFGHGGELCRLQAGGEAICLCFQMAGAAATKGQQIVTRTRPYRGRGTTCLRQEGGGGGVGGQTQVYTLSLVHVVTCGISFGLKKPGAKGSWWEFIRGLLDAEPPYPPIKCHYQVTSPAPPLQGLCQKVAFEAPSNDPSAPPGV